MTCTAAGLGPTFSAWERIYADYLAGNRLEEYRRLLESSLALGFCHWTLADLSAGIAANSIAPDAKVFVHRHDIDTTLAAPELFSKSRRPLAFALRTISG